MIREFINIAGSGRVVHRLYLEIFWSFFKKSPQPDLAIFFIVTSGSGNE
jgi:hypothetical protein